MHGQVMHLAQTKHISTLCPFHASLKAGEPSDASATQERLQRRTTMNNQLDEPAALHLADLSCDPVAEALSRLEHLPKERRKKAALQLLSQLTPAERTDIAQKTGM